MATIKLELELSYAEAELLRQVCEIEAGWVGVYSPHEQEIFIAIEAQLQEKLNKVAKKVHGQCRK